MVGAVVRMKRATNQKDMATYFCKTCDNNSRSEPFDSDQCDICWEKENEEIPPEICPKYNAQVLPDEDGNCSLCGEHRAVTN